MNSNKLRKETSSDVKKIWLSHGQRADSLQNGPIKACNGQKTLDHRENHLGKLACQAEDFEAELKLLMGTRLSSRRHSPKKIIVLGVEDQLGATNGVLDLGVPT